MQTPLLGLAIAVIVAVVTALIGPLFIDWNRYRPQIEVEATHLVGAPVRVVGAINARLLPTPSITLGSVSVGESHTEINARLLAIEFSLGALLRGQWRAAEMRLVGPQFNLAIASDGRVGMPALATGLNLDSLVIDRLNVDDGSAIFADAASGSRLVLEKLWFEGEIRSLLGPFRGEGAFVIGGELYGYRVSAARGDENGLKIKFSVDQSNRPLSAEAEGIVSLDNTLPRFEGTLTLTRPASAVLSGGKSELNQPWRATSHVKATHASALFEQIEFQFGAEERAIKFGGTAQMKFGELPKLDGVLYARQLNLDRLLADTDAQRRLPFAAIKTFAQNFAGAWRPPFPIAIGIGIDTLMLSGSPIQSVRGDIVADAGGWNVKTLELRAPGLTDITLSGRLDITATSLGFSGPIEATASDPKALIAWLEGQSEPQPGPTRALRVKGEVTLGAERIAVERLFAEIDRKSFMGRLAYVWAIGDKSARLDAAFNAGELDVDALIGFTHMVLAGTKVDPPGEVSLAASIDRATIAGIDARQVQAMLRLDRNGLAIERLSLADFGGAALEASGRIDTSTQSPHGTLTLNLDARHLGGATVLASTFLPQAADPLRRLADRIGAIKLRATLDMSAADRNSARTSAKLSVDGLAGAARVRLRVDASGQGFSMHDARVRADGKLEADDGAVLIKVMGLDTLVAGARGTSQVEISADGPLDGLIKLNGRFAAGEFQATAVGTTRLFAEDGVSGDLQISVIDADIRKLRPASAPAGNLPLSLAAKLVLSGARLTLNDISGKIAEGAMRGRLGFDLTTPARIDGRIEIDSVDISAAIAAVAGMPASPPGEAGPWPNAPFQPSFFPDLSGSIDISSVRAALTPCRVASNWYGRLRVAISEIVLAGSEGGISGGRFNGTLILRKEG
ncbi:MAG: AsmA family protein, partial [Rhizobiales bacterium]|nr:AsmA family protein [Hyphomicrobiales bacterium]